MGFLCFVLIVLLTGSAVAEPVSSSFLVLSDPHGWYDGSWAEPDSRRPSRPLKKGKAQDDWYANVRILLVSAAKDPDLDFVVIAGDLTVDGERTAHKALSRILADYEAAGSRIFIVPGNHDVNNPKAKRLDSKNRLKRTRTVSAESFVSLYNEFGYSEAFSRDRESLSYAAEPVEGLVLLALDTANWKDNRFGLFRHTTVKGIVRQSTMGWIESVLEEARKLGKTVVALQHHPFYDPREKTKKVISGGKKLAALYAEYGIAVVVAGHEHYYAVERGEAFPMILAPNASETPAQSLLVELGPEGLSIALDPFGFAR